MLDAIHIEYKLSQIVHFLSEKFSLEESMDCVLKLFFLKRLVDQPNKRAKLRLNIFDEYEFIIEDDKLSEILDELLTDLEHGDPSLEGVFKNPEANFWSRFDNQTLRHTIAIFAGLDLSEKNLSNSNDLSIACENFIERYATSETHRKRIYTPRHLAGMLVELTNPEQEASIYDPVCGSGEVLAASIQLAKRFGRDPSRMALFGQSTGSQERGIAKINLMLHGVNSPNIQVGNAILEPQFVENGKLMLFDRVLTNPPFGLRLSPQELKIAWNSNHFPYGVPNSGRDGIYLFIQHVLSSLKETGKAAMILPRGVLFRGSEKRVRKNIIESDQIEAIIELAPKLFYSTSIPVVVMTFNRNKANKNHILLINASHEYETERGRNHLQPKHVERIVSTYLNFNIEEGFSKLVSTEEIAASEYDLTVDRYLIQNREEFDITAKVNNLRQLEIRESELEKSMDAHIRALGIKL